MELDNKSQKGTKKPKKPKKVRSKQLIFKVPLHILVVALVILGLLLPFFITLYNFPFYENQFEQNGVFDVLGRDNTQLATSNLFFYFKCRDTDQVACGGSLDVVYENNGQTFAFSQDEKDHLKDVKNLILAVTWLIVFLSLTSVFYIGFLFAIFRRRKKLPIFLSVISKVCLRTGMYLLIVFGVLALSLLLFNTAFSVFHSIFFPQGNFAFPIDSLIITLFPQAFFVAYTKQMVNMMIGELVAFIVLGIVGFSFTRKIKTKNTLEFK